MKTDLFSRILSDTDADSELLDAWLVEREADLSLRSLADDPLPFTVDAKRLAAATAPFDGNVESGQIRILSSELVSDDDAIPFVPAFTVFYILRDQWVSFLRAAAAGVSSKADMKAGWSGKIRTALSFPIGCLLYAYLAFHWGWLTRPLMMGVEVFGLAVNFYSVYDYTKRYGFALRKNFTA